MSIMAPTSWGSWTLGDLSDVLRRVSELLGPTSDVSQVTVFEPVAGQSLPRVQVQVSTTLAVSRLLDEAHASEYVVAGLMIEDAARWWEATVAGLLLWVGLEEESS